MSGHQLVFDFNMTERLGKQTLDFCESFVQLSKQCLRFGCQNNVSLYKKKKMKHVQLGLSSALTALLLLADPEEGALCVTYFCTGLLSLWALRTDYFLGEWRSYSDWSHTLFCSLVESLSRWPVAQFNIKDNSRDIKVDYLSAVSTANLRVVHKITGKLTSVMFNQRMWLSCKSKLNVYLASQSTLSNLCCQHFWFYPPHEWGSTADREASESFNHSTGCLHHYLFIFLSITLKLCPNSGVSSFIFLRMHFKTMPHFEKLS